MTIPRPGVRAGEGWFKDWRFFLVVILDRHCAEFLGQAPESSGDLVRLFLSRLADAAA